MPRLALLLLTVVLAGCATAKDPKPAICDGHHRRPANPYGSVLPNAPLAGSAEPKAAPGPLSAADPKSFAPCGRPA